MFLVVFGFVSPLPAAVRAVIDNCCVGSGTIIDIGAANFQVEQNFSTGAFSVGGFAISHAFALTGDGRHAVVKSSITESPTVGEDVITVVNLENGESSQSPALPHNYYSWWPLAVNPVSSSIYNVYTDQDNDSHVQQIDPTNLQVTADVDVGTFFTYSMIVSPDGKKIYLENENPAPPLVLSASDLSTDGTLPTTCNGPIAISPDSMTIYEPDCNGIEIIDAATLQIKTTVPFALVATGSGFSPDGLQLYLATSDGEVCTLTTSTLALSCVSVGPAAYQVNVSPSGTLYIGPSPQYSAPGQVSIFDPATQSIAATFQLPSEGILQIGPDGSHLYYMGLQVSQIASTGMVPSTAIAHTGTINRAPGPCAYDAADSLVMCGDSSGRVEVLDAADLQIRGFVTIPGFPAFVGFNGRGVALGSATLAIGRSQNAVVFFDPATLTVEHSVPLPCGDVEFGFTALGPGSVYVGLVAGRHGTCSGIAVIDTQQMVFDRLLTPVVAPYQLVIPAGGGAVGYGIEGQSLQRVIRMDLNTGQILTATALPPSTSSYAGLACSPDGSTLYLSLPSGTEGTLYALDAQTLKIIASSNPEIGGSISVTPDDQYIYSVVPEGINIILTSSLEVIDTLETSTFPNSITFVGTP